MRYTDYVVDKHFLDQYNAYQARYAVRMPERDKVTLQLLGALASGKNAKVLDIGCSTGNLLLHMKRLYPQFELHGGDLAESSIAVARANPELAGISIRKMDMLSIDGHYDVIISNAVTYLFDDVLFAKAAASVRKAAKSWIDFDWFSPFDDQRLTIREVSPSHPDGLDIHVRPYNAATELLRRAGFQEISFRKFEIPIDLPFRGFAGDPITYTEKTADGRRLQLRGALYQPWHHLIANA